MLRVGLIGLGKMGISHLAIINSHPGIRLVAVCDPTPYVPDVLAKYTGVKIHSDYRALLDKEELDAVSFSRRDGACRPEQEPPCLLRETLLS